MTSFNSLLILLVSLYFGNIFSLFLDSGCQSRFVPMMINASNAARAPWMAYLIKNGNYICGGSLVAPNFVLTAAHCAQLTDNFYARLGEYDTSTTEDGTTYDIKVIAVFPEPRGQDIAVLKLAVRVMTYTETIRPICIVLFSNNYEVQELRSVRNFTVTGWGRTSRYNKNPATTLQEMEVAKIDPSICGNPVGQICCENPSQFVCGGDSGSPLTGPYKSNHVTSIVQYGLLSYGHEKCYDYARYVDIVQYTAWIHTTVIHNFY